MDYYKSLLVLWYFGKNWFFVCGNRILVPEYGVMQLELIPILVGFFTYKIATFLQAIEDAVSTINTKKQA